MAQAPHTAPRSSLSDRQPRDDKPPPTIDDKPDETTDEAPTQQPAVPMPLAGPTTAAVRITNVYVQGAASQLDVVVAKTGSGGNISVPPGHSAIVLLSDTITGISAGTVNSGARTAQPVDIG
jgi:hypothetical protein